MTSPHLLRRVARGGRAGLPAPARACPPTRRVCLLPRQLATLGGVLEADSVCSPLARHRKRAPCRQQQQPSSAPLTVRRVDDGRFPIDLSTPALFFGVVAYMLLSLGLCSCALWLGRGRPSPAAAGGGFVPPVETSLVIYFAAASLTSGEAAIASAGFTFVRSSRILGVREYALRASC